MYRTSSSMRLYPVYALIVVLVSSLFYMLVFPPPVWYVLGYYLTADEVKLAQYLVEQGLPASDCHRLLHFAPMAPSVSEKRLDCIVRYAAFAKDPAVCERLMPSEYGLYCLNNVMSKQFTNDAEAEHVTLDQCRSITGPSLKHDNCLLKAAHKSRDPVDCASISNGVIRSGCTLKLQAWQAYPQLRTSLHFGQGR